MIFIKSQEGELINLNAVAFIKTNHSYVKAEMANNTSIPLGKYASEEQAQKALGALMKEIGKNTPIIDCSNVGRDVPNINWDGCQN